MSAPTDIRALVVLEQTLGHVTHGRNLMRLLPGVDGFAPTFAEIEFDVDGWRARVPGYGNWTVRAGLRARRAVRRLRRRGPFDALVVHTQVPAVLMGSAPGGVPMIVSLDATPRQYDELGEHYAHETGPAPVERAKTWLNTRCYRRAARIVVWAEWTRRGLVDDYGIDADKITVIPPGVDTGRWVSDTARPATGEAATDDVVRILFVGGDLRRKGGHHLLTAFDSLRERYGTDIELHLVTPTPVGPSEGVTVHASMTPNSPQLIELYHRCDVFCLPTLGDCLPMVLAEAGAAGLALVSTDVGAIDEIVRHEETGLLVPVDDADALGAALRRLIDDVELRERLASAASDLVLREHDAGRNARRLVAVVGDAVESARR